MAAKKWPTNASTAKWVEGAMDLSYPEDYEGHMRSILTRAIQDAVRLAAVDM